MQVSLKLREHSTYPSRQGLLVRVLSGRRGLPVHGLPVLPPPCPGGRLYPGRAGVPMSTPHPTGISEPSGRAAEAKAPSLPALPSSIARVMGNHRRKSASGRIWVNHVRPLTYLN